MAEQLLETFQQDAAGLLDQVRKIGNNVLLEDTIETVKVLFDIENIYKHSLSSGMFGQSSPWNYLKNFTGIVPAANDLIAEIKASAKTNDGRLRLFIRLSLNSGNLTSYTRTLVSVKPSIRKYYTEESIMLREELNSKFVDQLSLLEHDIQFRLFVKDSAEFDQNDYWALQFKNVQNSISTAASHHVDEDILKIGQRKSTQIPVPSQNDTEENKIDDTSPSTEADPEDKDISISNENITNDASAEDTPPIDDSPPKNTLTEATSGVNSLNASVNMPDESPPSVVDMSDLEDTMKMLDEIERTVPSTISLMGSALLSAAVSEDNQAEKVRIEDDEDRLRRDEERLNILDEVFEQQKKEKEDKQKKFTEMNNSRRSSVKLRRSQVVTSQPSSTKTSVEITTTTVTSSATSPRERVTSQPPTDVDYSKSLKDMHAARDRSQSQPLTNSPHGSTRRLSASPSLNASTGSIGGSGDDEKTENGLKSTSSSTTTSPRASNANAADEKELIDRRPAWVDDKDAVKCAKCDSKFSLVTRRHHCRSCGKVFCSKCCKDKIPLPHLAYTKPVLVCDDCLAANK